MPVPTVITGLGLLPFFGVDAVSILAIAAIVALLAGYLAATRRAGWQTLGVLLGGPTSARRS